MSASIDEIVDKATKDAEFAASLREELVRQCLTSTSPEGDRLGPEWDGFLKIVATHPQELFKLELTGGPASAARRGRRRTATLATLATLTSLTVIVATPTALTTLTTLTTTTTTAND